VLRQPSAIASAAGGAHGSRAVVAHLAGIDTTSSRYRKGNNNTWSICNTPIDRTSAPGVNPQLRRRDKETPRRGGVTGQVPLHESSRLASQIKAYADRRAASMPVFAARGVSRGCVVERGAEARSQASRWCDQRRLSRRRDNSVGFWR
jgi:hypothetical protein